MIDGSGGIEYSKILVINAGDPNTMTIKFSNPVYSAFTIFYESNQNERCNIRIFNMAGVQVYTQSVNVQAGSNRILVPGSALNLSGAYVLEMTGQMNNRSAHKLVKM